MTTDEIARKAKEVFVLCAEKGCIREISTKADLVCYDGKYRCYGHYHLFQGTPNVKSLIEENQKLRKLLAKFDKGTDEIISTGLDLASEYLEQKKRITELEAENKKWIELYQKTEVDRLKLEKENKELKEFIFNSEISFPEEYLDFYRKITKDSLRGKDGK